MRKVQTDLVNKTNSCCSHLFLTYAPPLLYLNKIKQRINHPYEAYELLKIFQAAQLNPIEYFPSQMGIQVTITPTPKSKP